MACSRLIDVGNNLFSLHFRGDIREGPLSCIPFGHVYSTFRYAKYLLNHDFLYLEDEAITPRLITTTISPHHLLRYPTYGPKIYKIYE